MKVIIALAIIGCLPAAAVAQAPSETAVRFAKQCGMLPDEFLRFAATCESRRRLALGEMRNRIETANGDNKEILVQHRRSLEARDKVAYPELAIPLKPGAIGALPNRQCRVLKTVGENSMKAEIAVGSRKVEVLIKGVPASKFTAGTTPEISDCFRVSGRPGEKNKKSPAGPAPVMSLEAFDTKPVTEFLKTLYPN